jgi:hypothetical protein
MEASREALSQEGKALQLEPTVLVVAMLCCSWPSPPAPVAQTILRLVLVGSWGGVLATDVRSLAPTTLAAGRSAHTDPAAHSPQGVLRGRWTCGQLTPT